MRNSAVGGASVNAQSEVKTLASNQAPVLRAREVMRRHRNGGGVGPLDLDLDRSQVLGLLGPSGCGKSTLLRVIAGIETVDRGRIEIDGRSVASLPPGRRSVGLLEQHLPLYEHLDVRDNVKMAVSGLDLGEEERQARIDSALATARATTFSSQRASTLSGGERARTSLARLLARRPAIALLDEPFSGLDRGLRVEVRQDTLETLTEVGVGIVLVSHDQVDLPPTASILELTSGGVPVRPVSS